MILNYNHFDIKTIYNILVNKATKYYKRGLFDMSIDFIECASLLQYNYNDIFTDPKLEALLESISCVKYTVKEDTPLENVYLWYDAFSLDNRGLTQQYIDAIASINTIKFVYVSEKNIYPNGKHIYDYLRQCNNCLEIVELKGCRSEKIVSFISILSKYNPKRVFLHLLPWSTIPWLALNKFPKIVVYQVNLTDHAYWLGVKRLDFCLEFRDYGCSVSLEKRGISNSKLIKLPYYPWMISDEFEGLPKETAGKIILFSGGSLYKITGKEDFFFYLVRDVLMQNPDSVFIYAGEGDDVWLRKLIVEYGLEKRFFLLGNRTDICEVFKRCDIYIGTFPFAGGLMSQYAAMYEKPILAYSDNKERVVEELICTKKYEEFTFFSRKDFLEEAKRLISNLDYRNKRGLFFRELVQTQDVFRKNFYDIMVFGSVKLEYSNVNVDYIAFRESYLFWLNQGVGNGLIEKNMIKNLGFDVIKVPKLIVNVLPYLCSWVVKKIKGLIRAGINVFFLKSK